MGSKKFVITKKLADELSVLPAAVVGGIVKHLCRYVFCGEASDPKYRKFEKMLTEREKASAEDCERIIAYMNSRLGTRYTVTDEVRTKISARFAAGRTVEDFVQVIDTKAEEWMGTDCAKYLRPSTLFGTNFDAYLNQKAVMTESADTAEGSFETGGFFATALAAAERSGGVCDG